MVETTRIGENLKSYLSNDCANKSRGYDVFLQWIHFGCFDGFFSRFELHRKKGKRNEKRIGRGVIMRRKKKRRRRDRSMRGWRMKKKKTIKYLGNRQ